MHARGAHNRINQDDYHINTCDRGLIKRCYIKMLNMCILVKEFKSSARFNRQKYQIIEKDWRDSSGPNEIFSNLDVDHDMDIII